MAIKSVEKAIDILNCFQIEKTEIGVTEISKLTGLTPSTASRILSTLEQKGCLEKTGEQGRYRLGLKFYIWGNIVQQQTSFPEIALPVMEELRDKCREEVSLFILHGESRVCLKKVPSLYGVAKVSTTGKSLPLHCGASGKLLLAYLPEERRKKLLTEKPLKKYTPFTITDPEQLENELAQIRKQGYAVSTNEREIGAYSIVAPIRDASNKVLASLAVSGPTFRLSEEQLETYIQRVISAAAEISAKLGHESGG